MEKKISFLKKPAVQTLIASLLCILLGLLVGFIVLLIINPSGAWNAMSTIMRNFWSFSSARGQIKNFGNTLAKTAPLLMCSLSVLFAYKVGLFNIGAAGQYVAGVGVGLYFAIGLQMPWWVSLIAGTLAGALLGALSGILKAYRNVNEVISCIMLNWISLYLVNTLLAPYMDITMSETWSLKKFYPSAVLPSLGLESLLNNHQYVTIAIPMAILLGFGVSTAVALLSNYLTKKRKKKMYMFWSRDLDPVEVRIEAFGIGRMAGSCSEKNSVQIPYDIISFLAERYGLQTEKLMKPFLKGLVTELNDRKDRFK